MAGSTSARDEQRRSAVRTWAVWSAILVLYLLVRVPLLDVPLDRDEGAFGVVGQAILRGELPYRDIADHKPPGVFYLYALALGVVRPSSTGVHLFLLVWNLATLLVVASLARALAGDRAARWTGFLFVPISTAPFVQGYSANAEMLLLLPLAASFRLCVAALGKPAGRRRLWLLLSGALAAAACWIKQPAGVALLVVPLFVMLHPGARPKRSLADLGLWLAAGLAASAAVVAPFVVAGVAYELWYWAFLHSLQYGGQAWGDAAVWMVEGFARVLPEMGLPLLAGLAGAWLAWPRGRPHAWVGFAFLACSVASLFHSAFFYPHYFALLVPAVALAGGLGCAWLQELCVERLGRAVGRGFVLVAVLLSCAVPVATRPWYWVRPRPAEVSFRVLGAQAFDASPLLADYVRERTRPDERIFVYGSEPQIAFLARRRDANPFVMVYPLTGPWSRQREFQQRTWAAIERAEPAFIVVTENPLSLLRDPKMDPFFERKLDGLIRRDYRPAARVLFEPGRGTHLETGGAGTPPSNSSRVTLFEVWRRNGR